MVSQAIKQFFKPTVIDEHPASQTVFVSEKANLCVTTTGTTPTGYQWQRALLPGRERGKDGREEGEGEDGREEEEGGEDGMREEEKWKDVAEGGGHIGATSMRLDLPCVDTSMDGLYRCAVVKKGNARLMSNAARLTVVMRSVILKQPHSVHRAALSNAVVFTLEAKGTGVLEHCWWRRAHSDSSSYGSGDSWEELSDCLQCSGAGTPSLTIFRVSLEDEGEYKCLVASQYGDLWSDVAVLSVCSPPVIKVQPRDVRGAEPKTSFVIELEAEGRAPLCFQWERKPLVPLANAATASSHQKILQEFSPQIRRLLNVSSLLPHLLGRFLLTEGQHQELLLPNVTDIRKADLLPQWLPHSKTNYLEEFVQCLENDDQHQGHGELAELLRGRMKEDGWEVCGGDDHELEGVATPRLALPCANRSAKGLYRCKVWNDDGSVTSDEAVVSFLSDDEVVERYLRSCSEASASTRKTEAINFLSRFGNDTELTRKVFLGVVKAGELDNVEVFLSNGVHPDFLLEGWSSLHCACVHKDSQIIQSLLNAGCDCFLPNKDGRTALHLLCQKEDTASIELLARHVQSMGDVGEKLIKCVDKDGATALHIAARNGQHEVVSLLLKWDCKCINYQDNDLNTPLHLAVMSKHLDVVKLLDSSGASSSVENKSHVSPCQLASHLRLREIEDVLLHVNEDYTDSATPRRHFTGVNYMPESPIHWRRHSSELSVRSEKMAEGTILKQGVLKKCNRKASLEDREFILMPKVLLYRRKQLLVMAKPKCEELSLSGLEVAADDSIPTLRDHAHSFTVRTQEKGLILVASSEEEKTSWIVALRRAASLVNLPDRVIPVGLGAKAPVMVPDTHVTQCQVCFVGFTFTNRKHHCRACGKVVCGVCSNSKAFLAYLKAKDRVCKVCIGNAATHNGEGEHYKAYGKDTVQCGYVTRQDGVRMWYQLKTDNVLYRYKAHEDRTTVKSFPLLGYTIQLDYENYGIKLNHRQTRSDLSDAFTVSSVEEMKRWHEALQKAVKES